jgi:hypothetical protein
MPVCKPAQLLGVPGPSQSISFLRDQSPMLSLKRAQEIMWVIRLILPMAQSAR